MHAKNKKKVEDEQSFSFIKTKGAMMRIKAVIDGIQSGIPLLLEGETGTSKTATARKAAEEINQKAIVLNFSSQTSVEDLLGRVSKNNDSWSGFSFIKGKYTEAFEQGYCIILDEINLAHETVLQCIEASLDSRKLSLDFAGSEVDKTIQMHQNFHLIATQNPLTNRFSQKRNFLSHKLTSRFQKITFNEIGYDELIEIANGLSKDIKGMTPLLVKSIVKFHFEWQKRKSLQINSENSSSNVFTIREICRTIKSIGKGLTPFESILINYGARYNDQSKEEMKDLLKSMGIKEDGTFFRDNNYLNMITKAFSSENDSKIIKTKRNTFYMTEILKNVLSMSFHLLDNFQSILIVGPDGCGKTSIGRWIGDLYSTITKKSDSYDYKFFICNPEMMISDIIGRYILYKKENKKDKERIINEVQIEWKYGPIVDAMKNGNCLILDLIDTAPSTILERINSVFDGIGQENFKFPIQENLENPEVLVNPNFRLIAISSLEGLKNLSPAFLNRFIVIHVNEQLDFIGNELDKFINCISPIPSLRFPKLIKLVTEKIKEEVSNKGTKLTSLSLSHFVNGFFKLKEQFQELFTAKDVESIITFCLHSCVYHSKEIPELDDSFIDTMLDNLDEDIENNEQYDTFHFKEAKSTKKVMAALVAASIIGLHTILVGRTGIGKTAAAMAFSRTLKSNKKKNATSHIISFNDETQLEDLYGYFTIEDGNFTDHHGELSQAMSNGKVFIADELNLAEQKIIQSLNVAIEPSIGDNIILPVTGSSITINHGFFFIGCQNDLTMKGRKQLPESIKKKILYINYPEPSFEDFQDLCVSIAKPYNIDSEIAIYTSRLIEEINADPKFKSWSLREVRILFRRISYFQYRTNENKNFTPLHYLAFMLMSNYKEQPRMDEEKMLMSNYIADYICKHFNKETKKESLLIDLIANIKVIKYFNGSSVSQEVIDSMKQNSEMKNYSSYLVKLVKGSLELIIDNKQLFFIPDNIQHLWEIIFEVYLTYPSEPLLLSGPSGFKTYLSLLISSLSPVIYLHSNSTVSSLIGQITLLDRHQAKINLVDFLYDFTGYNLSLKNELNDIKASIVENNEFDIDILNSIVEKIKKILPNSFISIIQNIANRLITIQKDESDQHSGLKLFSNFISLFKPGLITRSIFSQNSLILKNFAQPSPSVIERLNELLSVIPTLTLFEDTTNTFTTEKNNKLYGFSNNFRIIGICDPFEKKNLSDAMLSRLTEIHVPEYSIEEQENVFLTYLQDQRDKSRSLFILKQINKFNFTFKQKIKIIEVSIQWQKKYPKMDLETIYSISILRCAGETLSFEKRQELYQSMIKDSFKFPSGFSQIYQNDIEKKQDDNPYKYTTEKSCLSLNQGDDIITSTITSFTFPNISFSNNFLNKKPNLRFSKPINDLIDAIFSFSIINYPLIIEGPNGCGKSSAFYYVAQCLGMKVIQISLSQRTTIEDLFGRYEPSAQGDSIHFEFKPTAFLNAIDNDRNNGGKYWIIIEDLHLASPSVIDALEPIFNFKSNHVTLPDGSFVQKSNFFIVGLLTKQLQKQSITKTALYYKMPNYTKNEFSEICSFILEMNELNDSIQRICPILSQLFEISSSSQVKVPITPREAYKFVKMMKASSQYSNNENKYNDIQICQLLSLGRFYDDELKAGIIQNINEAVRYQVFSLNEEIPEFIIENSTLSSKNILINSSIGIQPFVNDINHLTKSEKQLFEFLILNTNEYTPILVQGPTASGKTFSIQLFASILGKKLKVLQMNQEIDSSFIAGTYSPSKDLSSNDILELQSALELLNNMIQILPIEFQPKLNHIEIDKWKLSDFLKLKKSVEKLMKEKSLNEIDFNNASEFLNKVNSTLLIFKHINRNDSIIVKALTNGDWLLLDGIESATSDFLDRLSSLLDNPPILNLYERGNDYFFSMNPDTNNKLIHPNFRLFLTYNPINSYFNNVSQSFLSRCTVYSMSPIDSNVFDSAVIVSSIIDKSVFSFSSQSEISARIANVHMKMKEKNQKILTCRTLLHISQEINHKNQSQKMDKNQLISVINNHYNATDINSIYNDKIDEQLINQLKKLEMNNIKIRNIMIENLREFSAQIANISKNKNELELIFKYNSFLSNMHILQYKYYESIVQEFYKIHDLIEININQFSKQQLSYLASFNTLSVLFIEIFGAFNECAKSMEIQNLCLDSAEVKKHSNLKEASFRFQSFQYLYNNHFYLDHIPNIFINDAFSKSFLSILSKTERKTITDSDIEKLKKNPYSFLLNFNDLSSKPYKYDENIDPIQQICNTFFKFEDCSFLFTDIMRDFYSFSYLLFSINDFNIFCEWIKWLNQFFISFKQIIDDFNISFNDFHRKLQKVIKDEDSDLILQL